MAAAETADKEDGRLSLTSDSTQLKGSASSHTSSQSHDPEKGPITSEGASESVEESTPTTQPNTTKAETDPNIVDWDGENDPECPLHWPQKLKLTSVILVSSWTFLTPLASSMVAPGTLSILNDFNSDNLTLGAFIVSIYILGYAVGPLFIGPLSEIYGRLPVYHACNILFVAWSLGCAFAPSLGALLAFRFLQGMAGVCALTIGSGTIADLIAPERRGAYMSAYSMGPLLGPCIGPIAGAFLNENEGWRWIFRVLVIASGLMMVLTFVIMRESYHPTVLQRKTKRLQQETGNMNLRSKLDSGLSHKEIFLRAIVRPTKMLIFSPIVFLLSLYMAVVYGYLYLLFTTITALYEQVYHFTEGTAGLSYLGIGVGMFFGLAGFGTTSDRLVAYQMKKYNTARKPEYRLPVMMVGAALVPIGLFWYGWSAQERIHYIMPIIGSGFVGAGLILTFMPISVYLVDAYTIYAASAMAANTVLRSLVGAFLPLAGPSMYNKLGLGWGNSLLAFIAIALWPVSILFYKYGERIRTSKRFKVEF